MEEIKLQPLSSNSLSDETAEVKKVQTNKTEQSLEKQREYILEFTVKNLTKE